MIDTKRKLGAVAVSAALFSMSAVPVQASWWDYFKYEACTVGCDMSWASSIFGCGVAADALAYGCYLQIPSSSVQETINCYADVGDFRDACCAIADWDNAHCEYECA